MDNPLVYIVVLNYNGERWLEACLRSLLATRYDNLKILVVDNASTDGSVELVKSLFPLVEIIINPSNYGFSEGNNVGIRQALSEKADYVVLLNTDTRVQPDWLINLLKVGESEPSIGILGPVQLCYENSDFNSWTKAALSQHLDELDEGVKEWIAVDWVEGSSFAVKREVFDEIGLLDPIYFAFFEEIDFCRRAICQGYRIALVPRSRIHHHRGGTWQANPRVRDYRCDCSQFIYSLTDPRKTILGNLSWYLVTLATKCKELLADFSFDRAWDLLRMQIEVIACSGRLVRKWRRDRLLLRKAITA
jgi:GT2 family glycosyltransferase